MTDTTPTPKPPTLLVDTDALIDLDRWQEEAAAKRWLHFFLHIAEAQPRHPELLDAIELAKGDGVRVEYTSRWIPAAQYLLRDWLAEQGYPGARMWMRRNPDLDAADLAAQHGGFVSTGKRPVLLLHNDAEVAASLRKRHIAALAPAQLPHTVEGLRKMFALARPVAQAARPERKKEAAA